MIKSTNAAPDWNYCIRITRWDGVKALIPDCGFLQSESAAAYIAKYVPKYQQPEIVAVQR